MRRSGVAAGGVRGIRFLAEYALAAGEAYAVHVGPTGLVSIQGDQGTLQHLVQMLDARPREVDAGTLPMREWAAAVPLDGGTVLIELTETGG